MFNYVYCIYYINYITMSIVFRHYEVCITIQDEGCGVYGGLMSTADDTAPIDPTLDSQRGNLQSPGFWGPWTTRLGS